MCYNFLEQFYVSCLSFMKGDETTTESKLINYQQITRFYVSFSWFQAKQNLFQVLLLYDICHNKNQDISKALTYEHRKSNRRSDTISDNRKSIKMMKSDFYLILKTLFVLVIFTFLSYLFGYVLKRLDKKTKVNFNIYDVADWTTNTIYTLPHISRRKGNQTMEFGQLIKKTRNIFLQKPSKN